MSDSPVITASGGTLIAERARHKPASKIVNPLRIGLQTERNPQITFLNNPHRGIEPLADPVRRDIE